MLAPLSALMTRALCLDARLARSHVLRLLLSLIMGFGVLNYGMRTIFATGSGRDLLWSLAWGAWWALLLLAAGRFASAITEEKADGCLSLLRMAGLRPLAILLGKATTLLWEALLLVGTLLPLAVLAVTLGGVSLGQVWAAVVLLAAWTVFLSGLGLLCSVLCRSHGAAAALLLAVVVIAVVGSAMAAAMAPSPTSTLAWSLTSWHRLSTILSLGFAGPALDGVVAAHGAGAAVCFALAWLLFERCATDSGTGGDAAPVSGSGALGWLPRPRRPGQGVAALRWKDFHVVSGGWPLLVLRALAQAVLISGGFLLFNPDFDQPAQIAGLLIGVALTWQVVDVGITLARVFAVEVRWQTLDDITVLPLSSGQQVGAKLVVVALSTLPATVVFVIGVGLAVPGIITSLRDNQQMLVFLGPMLLGYAARIVLFWYICALTSLFVRTGAFFAAIGITLGVWIAESMIGGILMVGAMLLSAAGGGASTLIGAGLVSMLGATITAGLCVLAHLWFMRRWRAMPGR